MEKLDVYVIMHKPVNLLKYKLDKCYKKLTVGVQETTDKDVLLDSVGDNISNKNKNYCELTGLYWIWKNSSAEYVGLCHYRRFLLNNFFILKEKKILKILENYDVILPYHEKVKKFNSIYDAYKSSHYIEDIDECRNIIKNLYPEYIEVFDDVMGKKVYYPCNMFIMPKELLNKYCEWLFNIFDELERRIDLSQRNDYQKRVYGFLSERLFTVWIKKNNLKIYESIMLKTDASIIQKIKLFIKIILKKLHLLWIIK